jgi:hypothetical protein
MKKVFAVCVALVLGVVLSPGAAEGQIILCGYCCNAAGVPVCSGAEVPCGAQCFCYGLLGSGFAC